VRTRTSTSALVRVGVVCGRDDRVRNPASPSAVYLSIQVFTHFRETPIAAAMCACFQPAWWRWTIKSRP
jgi:hypothetical protein